MPNDWTKQLLIPIHEKGSCTTCDNYRGVVLLNIPSKIFSRVILTRLNSFAEPLLCENQCGFVCSLCGS